MRARLIALLMAGATLVVASPGSPEDWTPQAILQPYADRPGAAISILKMLRVLIRHAINIGWLRQDPSLGIKRPKLQRIRSWTEQEIAT
jgi:hypothetical protein